MPKGKLGYGLKSDFEIWRNASYCTVDASWIKGRVKMVRHVTMQARDRYRNRFNQAASFRF